MWKFESAGNGYVYIKNKLGYYLDVCGGKCVNGTNVQVYTQNKSAAQTWRLTPKSFYTKSAAFISDSRFKNGITWKSSQRPKLSHYSSSGCCAYAADFAYYVAKCSRPTGISSYSSPKYIEPGDIIKVVNSQHWFVVLRRDGNKLTTVEGNCSGKVRYSTKVYTIQNGVLCSNGKKFRTFSAGYHLF